MLIYDKDNEIAPKTKSRNPCIWFRLQLIKVSYKQLLL